MSLQGVYKNNYCQYNTYHNKFHTFKDLNLKIVGGAVGISGWFEYGGKSWKMKEYKQKPTDIHFWLEDKNGNVYDYIQPHWNWVAKTRGVDYNFPNVELLGVSKGEIKRLYGIEYIPAPIKTQKYCYNKVVSIQGRDFDDKEFKSLEYPEFLPFRY